MSKANWPKAAERENDSLRAKIEELKAACKMAHDTLGDVAGRGVRDRLPRQVSASIDSTFRELVRVLYGIGDKPNGKPLIDIL